MLVHQQFGNTFYICNLNEFKLQMFEENHLKMFTFLINYHSATTQWQPHKTFSFQLALTLAEPYVEMLDSSINETIKC